MARFGEAFEVAMSRGPVYFAGRERELVALREEFLEKGARSATIVGQVGVGKTALAREFARANAQFFTGGTQTLPGVESQLPSPETVRQVFAWGGQDQKMGPRLLILDGVDMYGTAASLRFVSDLLGSDPLLRVIVTSQRPLPPGAFDVQIQLDPLTREDMQRIWQANLVDLPEREYDQLYSVAGGSPLVSTLAGRLVRDRITTTSELFEYLRPFSTPGLIGPDGRPLSTASPAGSQLVATTIDVNRSLIERISRAPDEIFTLTPRQFEELVAELFQRQGYEVTLTPASKDGGKDIYIAKQDHLGSLLYLVECKHWGRDHPVGVAVVRQLYGTVEEEKATGGIIATTSYFTRGAKEFRDRVRNRLTLKDYLELHKLIRRFTGGK